MRRSGRVILRGRILSAPTTERSGFAGDWHCGRIILRGPLGGGGPYKGSFRASRAKSFRRRGAGCEAPACEMMRDVRGGRPQVAPTATETAQECAGNQRSFLPVLRGPPGGLRPLRRSEARAMEREYSKASLLKAGSLLAEKRRALFRPASTGFRRRIDAMG